MFKVLGNLPADPRSAGTAVQSESLGERTRLVTPNRTRKTARAPGRARSYGWCDAVKARHVKVGPKEAATARHTVGETLPPINRLNFTKGGRAGHIRTEHVTPLRGWVSAILQNPDLARLRSRFR